MKERPIRLTEPEIVAVLTTRQTQFRHPIRLPAGFGQDDVYDYCDGRPEAVNAYPVFY